MGREARLRAERLASAVPCPECGQLMLDPRPLYRHVDGSIESICPACEARWIEEGFLWGRYERQAVA